MSKRQIDARTYARLLEDLMRGRDQSEIDLAAYRIVFDDLRRDNPVLDERLEAAKASVAGEIVKRHDGMIETMRQQFGLDTETDERKSVN